MYISLCIFFFIFLQVSIPVVQHDIISLSVSFDSYIYISTNVKWLNQYLSDSASSRGVDLELLLLSLRVAGDSI